MTDVLDATTDADELRVREAAEKLLASHPPRETDPKEFLGAQFDAGLAWVHFDEGHGGLGVGPKLQKVVQEVFRGTGAPSSAARRTSTAVTTSSAVRS